MDDKSAAVSAFRTAARRAGVSATAKELTQYQITKTLAHARSELSAFMRGKSCGDLARQSTDAALALETALMDLVGRCPELGLPAHLRNV